MSLSMYMKRRKINKNTRTGFKCQRFQNQAYTVFGHIVVRPESWRTNQRYPQSVKPVCCAGLQWSKVPISVGTRN